MKGFVEDSYCGLFCGACEIMQAYRNSIETGVPPDWAELPAALADHIEKGEIRCHGCKTDDVFAGCRKCGIRACAREKGVEFCFECGGYPCDRTEGMIQALERISEVMPHTKAIISNLAHIERKGRSAWIREQQEFWSCPRCGSRITWYQRSCGECKLVIESERSD